MAKTALAGSGTLTSPLQRIMFQVDVPPFRLRLASRLEEVDQILHSQRLRTRWAWGDDWRWLLRSWSLHRASHDVRIRRSARHGKSHDTFNELVEKLETNSATSDSQL